MCSALPASFGVIIGSYALNYVYNILKKVKFITFDPAYVFVFSLQKLTRGMFFHAILNKSRARRFNLRPSEFVPLIWVSCS